MASHVLDHVMDALDLETFLVCRTEDEARGLMLSLLKDLGFQDVDIVFIEQIGPGARIRARAYIHRSGDRYGWLQVHEKVKEETHG